MAKEGRFIIEKVDKAFATVTKVLIDKETGVHYLYHESGYSGGLTPLLDEQGNVVIKKPPLNY
jgi:hypothetical protein